jgi:hypothetical protein
MDFHSTRSPMTDFTIFLPLPRRELFPNFHGHWRPKHREISHARLAAKNAAMNTLGPRRPPMWEKCRMVVKFSMPHLRHDPANLMASLKAYEDGLQDAGIIANDRGLWPERPIIERDPCVGDHPDSEFRRGIVRITLIPE